MKNKFLKLLCSTLAVIVASSFFTACRDEKVEKKYDHLITFNYNVGSLGEALEAQYLGVMDNSYVAIQPGHSDAYKEGVLAGYYIEGWYTGKTDSEGNPVVGSDGRVELLEKWDFAANKVTADVVLYANFVQQAGLIIQGGDKEIAYSGQPGSIRKEPSKALAPKKKGYTFLGYFEDEGYKTPFVWPYTFEAGVTKTIYAYFLEGEWEVVSTAAQFVDGYRAGKNLYVTEDLDFSEITDWPLISYNGEIAGNNHTFSGIDIKIETSKTNKENFAIFGALGAQASLHDFTIENASISFNDTFVNLDYKVAMLAWKAEAGAKLTNLTVSGSITQKSLQAGSVVKYYEKIAIDGGAVINDCTFTDITLPSQD